MTRQDLRIEGMHCGSCSILIDEALEDLPGVNSSSTSLRRKRTRVEFDPSRTDLAAIAAAIVGLGYTATPSD